MIVNIMSCVNGDISCLCSIYVACVLGLS